MLQPELEFPAQAVAVPFSNGCAGRIAQVVAANEKLLAEARPAQAEVAIVYNPLSHFVGGRQRQAAYGGPQGEVAGIERDSLLGVYKALFPRHVPVDFVHAARVTAESLRPYKLVYLPYPLMLPASTAAVLRAYVEAGGRLVAEARPGWNDERGRASETIPGMGLAEVFGARETAVETAPQGRTRLVFEGGRAVPARWFAETLEVTRAQSKVVGRFENGEAAAVESSFGKGRALLVGSYVSAAYQTTPTAEGAAWFAGLLEWPSVTATSGW